MATFVDPYTKQPLEPDGEGNLFCERDGERVVYLNHDGAYDFVSPGARVEGEKHFYDEHYKAAGGHEFTLEVVRERWTEIARPEAAVLLASLGDLSGKRILLLGNGMSIKELYFLHLGAEVVYTDISIEAVIRMQNLYRDSELRERGYDRIEFHAVDGLSLPFPDSSFDIIYGDAFVHHIEDLDSFFAEVSRCLRDGGMCRFLDGSYSPLWQAAKRSVLRPIQIYAHRKQGISPEDLRATMRGGYRKEELEPLMARHGFKSMVFRRFGFFHYITKRGLGKVIGWRRDVFGAAKPLLYLAKYMDDAGEWTGLTTPNTINLVWGFDK